MKLLNGCLVAASAFLLSSCGQSHAPSSSAAGACQQRPSDAQIANTLSEVEGPRSGGIQLLGVSVSPDCNTVIAVYRMGTETNARDKQLLATDNGRWFIVSAVGFGGVQLTEIL